MQRHIKILSLLLILLFTIIACNEHKRIKGSSIAEDEQAILKERDSVYSVMQYEICDSVLDRMHNSKSAMKVFTDCYNETINRHYSALLKIGIDSTTATGKSKLDNGVLFKISLVCPDTYALVLKEYNEKYGDALKGLQFTGTLISQSKLSTGRFKIIMKDSKTADSTIFFSADSLDETQFKKFEPGYWITIKYEIVKNPHTHKNELVLKKGAMIGGVGAVEVNKQ